jgi:hypothetical protein
MADLPEKLPRDNPFWSYRDPLTGRWLTLMTANQCENEMAHTAFQPRVRQAPPPPDVPRTL